MMVGGDTFCGSMDATNLYHSYRSELEDFWRRRQSVPRHRHECTLFGLPIRVESNKRDLLQDSSIRNRAIHGRRDGTVRPSRCSCS